MWTNGFCFHDEAVIVRFGRDPWVLCYETSLVIGQTFRSSVSKKPFSATTIVVVQILGILKTWSAKVAFKPVPFHLKRSTAIKDLLQLLILYRFLGRIMYITGEVNVFLPWPHNRLNYNILVSQMCSSVIVDLLAGLQTWGDSFFCFSRTTLSLLWLLSIVYCDYDYVTREIKLWVRSVGPEMFQNIERIVKECVW